MKEGTKGFQESLAVVNGGLGNSTPSPQPLHPLSKKNGNPRNQTTHQDVEFDCDGQAPLLIPEGKYEVVFLRAERKWLWSRERLFLWFQIVNLGEFYGMELFMACNPPQKGKKGLVPISNKFYQAWILAVGKRPDRFDRMGTKVFRGKVFLAKVRTVKKNVKGASHSLFSQYSIIDDLLDRLTDSEMK